MSATVYNTILVKRNDKGFATLVMNRPDKNNTLSNEMRGDQGKREAMKTSAS